MEGDGVLSAHQGKQVVIRMILNVIVMTMVMSIILVITMMMIYRVISPPLSKIKCSQVSLECRADGDDPISIAWRREGR